MLNYDTPGLTLNEINGWAHIAVYTDGSLSNPKSQPIYKLDGACMLAQGIQTTTNHHFSAKLLLSFELNYVQWCMLLCALLVRSSCEQIAKAFSIYAMQSLMIKGYNHKRNDADLLQHIDTIHKHSPLERIIEWMPSHMDEPKNASKRAAFLANGGTEAHISGNSGADVLAGEGAL